MLEMELIILLFYKVFIISWLYRVCIVINYDLLWVLRHGGDWFHFIASVDSIFAYCSFVEMFIGFSLLTDSRYSGFHNIYHHEVQEGE